MSFATANSTFPVSPWGGSGWTCSQCGMWVMAGATHNCLRAFAPGTTVDQHLLERIATILEALLEEVRGLAETAELVAEQSNQEVE